jgi:hypothetical protein
LLIWLLCKAILWIWDFSREEKFFRIFSGEFLEEKFCGFFEGKIGEN